MGDCFGVCDSLVAGDNVDIVLNTNSTPESTHRGLINRFWDTGIELVKTIEINTG